MGTSHGWSGRLHRYAPAVENVLRFMVKTHLDVPKLLGTNCVFALLYLNDLTRH